MATGAALYTPQVLALATGLAAYPLTDGLPLHGQARSRNCGSTLELGLQTDQSGRITKLGLRAHACAIGQACAALFASAAPGMERSEIAAGLEAIDAWLAGDRPLPDWPGFAAIAAAREYPARHGAITLAWRAALDALPTG